MIDEILTGADVEPLITLSCDIAKNDGHRQFSILVGALVCLAQSQNISKAILHRAIDASFDYDGKTPQAPINLFDQA